MSTRMISPADLTRVALAGLRARRTRTGLSAIGIAIGIASIVAVLSLSQASKADLIAQLDALGTNLLEVTPGSTPTGAPVPLSPAAVPMVRRVAPVESATGLAQLDQVVRRNPLIPTSRGAGITAQAADLDLLPTLQATLHAGRPLNRATERLPAVVLGSVAAERLGISEPDPRIRIWIGSQPFAVVGVLDPLPLTPTIDRSALVGAPAARTLFNTPPAPSEIFVRTNPDRVIEVSDVLAATVDPLNPTAALISRPSDAITARIAAKSAFTSLFLGLGLVALLVGGVGIANVMIISVLERRSEVGLRRAMGATRNVIALQFLAESLILSGLGGALGAALGTLATTAYSIARGWPVLISAPIVAAGIAGALVVGTLAGIYPAARAARLSPATALRSV